jgi:NAD(P)-dependent dehydrogenase (short-subunit alcohol dehydrogenase family)
MSSVLITGCSSGFGRAMVDEFLKRGWHVVGTMRNAPQRREILAESLEKYSDRLTILSLEITEPSQRDAVVEAVRKRGRLDCLVNNAGYRFYGALEDLGEEQIRRQFEVNFFGAVFLTRALLPLIREAQGTLIFISSTFGFTGFPLTSAHCASKYALEGLAESLYYELESHGVRVALVEPGASKTTNNGKNMSWAEGNSETYRIQTENYRRLNQRVISTAQDNTHLVAKRVADIAEGSDRQLRRRVGWDAHFTHIYQQMLPDRLRLPLSKMIYRRLFTGSKSR